MPLTIHRAETAAEARTSPPDIRWDHQTHQQIFDAPDLELHDLGLFYHLSDYHQDTAFLGADVLLLRAEVEEARKRIHHPRATESLALLCRVCDAVIQSGGNLFAFGD